MELKVLGERLRMIRKHLGINQQQLADATNLTQPAISRLEKDDEVYASTLRQELRQRLSRDLAQIASKLDQAKEQADALRSKI